MALLTMAEMMKHAKANKYAIPAFNVFDGNSFQAAQLAAEQEDAPIILAGGAMGKNGEVWSTLALLIARNTSMPMAVHVDHGPSFEACMWGIRRGFTSVMIDASTKSFDENVAITKKVVDAAHAVGVTVEAELGHVGLGTDLVTDEVRNKTYTRVDEAIEFVKQTGVDALAVAVGTQHGVYKYEPILDFERLQQLNERVPAYLVIHGGSGTPGLEKVAKMGVTKINIATEIVQACLARIRVESVKEGWAAFQGINQGSIEVAKEAMVYRIRSFGANGHGKDLLKSLS